MGEFEGSVCDDEVVFLESSGSTIRARRVWPYVCACGIVAAVVGLGGRVMWNSSHVDELTSLYATRRESMRDPSWRNRDELTSLHATRRESMWDPSWRNRPSRFDEDGCTWDGDDCRASRCCAKAGSRCYLKSQHWASCNDTCSYNVKWEADEDRRGYWAVTSYPVWACVDLTATQAAVTKPVAEEVVVVTAATKTVTSHVTTHPPRKEVEVVTAQPTKFGIYEQEDDYDTKDYAPGAAPAVRAASSTHAPVTWEGLD